MKTYKQFMEQFSGHVIGSTNSRVGAAMAKRASNASAAEKADKKSEKIVAATNKEAKPVNKNLSVDSDGPIHSPIRVANASQVKQVAGDLAAAIRR